MIVRDVFNDPQVRRVLRASTAASVSEADRAALAQTLLSRFGVRVTSDRNLDTLFNTFKLRSAGVDVRAAEDTDLSMYSDAVARTVTALDHGNDPAIILLDFRRKVVAAAKRTEAALVEACSSPSGRRQVSRLMEEVVARKKSKSVSWLDRASAEAEEEILRKALKSSKDGEEEAASKGSKKKEGSVRTAALAEKCPSCDCDMDGLAECLSCGWDGQHSASPTEKLSRLRRFAGTERTDPT